MKNKIDITFKIESAKKLFRMFSNINNLKDYNLSQITIDKNFTIERHQKVV